MGKSGTTSPTIAPGRFDTEVRRRQLAEIAADLFYRGGFRGVPLSAVARAAGMTAPAIYRHFPNKQALLAASVDTGLILVERALVEVSSADWSGLVSRIAEICWRRRDLWILLQREVRHLDESDRVAVGRRVTAIYREFVARFALRRTDLDEVDRRMYVMAILAVLSSPSGPRPEEPAATVLSELHVIADCVADSVLPEVDSASVNPASAEPSGERSEQLLRTAVELFHAHGYASVSLDDVGAAVGVAGPSIYYHYDSKEQLLAEAFRRASAQLTPATDSAPADPPLVAVVRRWVDLAVEQPALFGVYITESRNLSPETAHEMAGLVAANITEWVDALSAVRPDLSRELVLVRVYAARAIVNDVVAVPRLLRRNGIRAELEAFSLAALYETPRKPS